MVTLSLPIHTSPLEAIWNFHLHFNPNLDLLIGSDPLGLNTGIFMTNCKSQTALDFLDEWHLGAPVISYYGENLYEQLFVNYVLISGPEWKHRVPSLPIFKERPMEPWNNYTSSKAREFPETWSTEALQQRLQLTKSQCAFSAYHSVKGKDLRRGFRAWKSGDATMHTAGHRHRGKMELLTEYLHRFNSSMNEQQNATENAIENALAYLQGFNNSTLFS